MERVQFEQEQMLSELKDLLQKGVFSEKECKQIIRKRTAFETALVRRVTKKSDFLRYLAYEMNLEALRRKRVTRLNLPHSPPTISDYAIVRRQFKIFERALRKFKDDVGLWLQYIRLAKREKARALVGRITARALQLHPTNPSLYILAASHELTQLSPSAARSLLQRGLRLNPDSVELWREHVNMELGFLESLRRRWEVLGVGKGKDPDGGADGDVEMVEGDDEAMEQEKARNEILSGALVKTVIDSAIQALPSLPLLSAIHSTIASYPIPTALRTTLLDHFFSTLNASPSLHNSPEVVKLHATRGLHAGLEADELVDELRRANEELMAGVTAVDGKELENMAKVYAAFVEEWVRKDIDENLKLYLLVSLNSLITSTSYASLSCLITHLRLLTIPDTPQHLQPPKLLKLARKYSAMAPRSPELWLLRLDIEAKLTEREEWTRIWNEARKSVGISNVRADEEKHEEVWLWGFAHIPTASLQERIDITESLLSESLPLASLTLSTKLLTKYIHLLHDQFTHECAAGTYKAGNLRVRLDRMAERYLPTEEVWEKAFELFSARAHETAEEDDDVESDISASSTALPIPSDHPSTLYTLFTHWRLFSPSAHCRAALAYGAWLLAQGRGSEAAEVGARAQAGASRDSRERAEFERRWRAIVDGSEGESDGEKEGRGGDDGFEVVG